MTIPTKRQKSGQRGSAVLEFALVSVVIIPLLFGLVATGVNLGNMIQSVQVSRDIGHMYAQGIDFSQTVNQNIAVSLTSGNAMTTTGGNGVITLSQVALIYQADCTAANLTNNCTNLNKLVFTNRIVIGNSSLQASRYGTPSSTIINASGNIAAADYLTNSTAVTSGLSAILTTAGLTPADGSILYLTEVYFATPSISFVPSPASTGIYASSIF